MRRIKISCVYLRGVLLLYTLTLYITSVAQVESQETAQKVTNLRNQFNQATGSGNINLSDSILQLYKEAIYKENSPTNINRFLIGVSNYHAQRESYDSSVYYLQKATIIIPDSLRSEFDWGSQILTLSNLGALYDKYYNNPTRAIPLLEEALLLSDIHNYPGYKLAALVQLAQIYERQGNIELAIKLSEDGLNDISRYSKYNGQNDENYFKLVGVLGTLYSRSNLKDDHKKGIEYLKKAIYYYQKEKLSIQESYFRADLAYHYSAYLTTEEQEEQFGKAIQLYGNDSIKHKGLKHILLLQSGALIQKGKSKNAIDILDQLVSTIDSLDIATTNSINYSYYEAFLQAKDYKSALNHYQKYSEGTERLNEKYTKSEVIELETKYDSKRQQRIADILRDTNGMISMFMYLSFFLLLIAMVLLFFLLKNRKKLKQQNKELFELNKSKNDLFLILAHDLKGPITSFDNISKRISFLLKKEDFVSLNKLSTYFENIGKSLKHTVYGLLDWSLSQKDNFLFKKEVIDIEDNIETIIEEHKYLTNDKSIEIILKNTTNKSIECDPNSFLIIFRNLLHNAIKYSKMKSEVIVNISEISNRIRIEIINDNSGLKQKNIEWMKSQILEESKFINMGMRDSGIGLQTAIKLIKHNHGKVQIKNTHSHISILTSFEAVVS